MDRHYFSEQWQYFSKIEAEIKALKDLLQNQYIKEHGKLQKGVKVKLDGEICTVSDTCVSEIGEIVYIVDWAGGGCAYVSYEDLELPKNI